MELGSMMIESTVKLCDFSKMERTGKVIYKPARPKQKKDYGLKLKSFTIADTTYGIPLRRDSKGEIVWMQIEVTNELHLDLSKDIDAKKHHVLKHYPGNISGVNPSSVKDIFCESEEEMAQKKIDKAENLYSAIEKLQQLRDIQELRDYGRLFGVNSTLKTEKVIKAEIIDILMKNPKQMIKMYEDADTTKARIIFERGIAFGLITSNVEHGYMFRDSIPMGTVKEGAVAFLRKNVDMMVTVDRESQEREANEVSAQTESTVSIDLGTLPVEEKASEDQEQIKEEAEELANISRINEAEKNLIEERAAREEAELRNQALQTRMDEMNDKIEALMNKGKSVEAQATVIDASGNEKGNIDASDLLSDDVDVVEKTPVQKRGRRSSKNK